MIEESKPGPRTLAQRRVFLSSLTSAQKLVLLALLDHWSPESPRPYPGIDRLAEWTSLFESTVRRAVRELARLGVLRVTRARPNKYDLSPLFGDGFLTGKPGTTPGLKAGTTPGLAKMRDANRAPRPVESGHHARFNPGTTPAEVVHLSGPEEVSERARAPEGLGVDPSERRQQGRFERATKKAQEAACAQADLGVEPLAVGALS